MSPITSTQGVTCKYSNGPMSLEFSVDTETAKGIFSVISTSLSRPVAPSPFPIGGIRIPPGVIGDCINDYNNQHPRDGTSATDLGRGLFSLFAMSSPFNGLLNGLTGATGPSGDVAATGPVCPVGPSGCTGTSGLSGLSGMTGAVGPSGVTGLMGSTGSSGSTGMSGPSCSIGANSCGCSDISHQTLGTPVIPAEPNPAPTKPNTSTNAELVVLLRNLTDILSRMQ